MVSVSRDHFRLHYLDLCAPTAGEVGGVLRAQRHKIMAAAVVLGGSVALAAFGLAPQSASESPGSETASNISVTADSLVAAQAIQAKDLPMVANARTQRGDTVRSLLQRLGVDDAVAEQHLRDSAAVRSVLSGAWRARVKADTDSTGKLHALRFIWLRQPKDERAQVLLLSAQADGSWVEDKQTLALTAHTRLASAHIQSSLFAASDAAQLPDSVAEGIAELFANEIDFRKDLRKNDRFSVAYQEWSVEGEVLRTGRILGVEFVNKGRTHQALWFAPKGEYFDAKGQSSKRQFLSSPMQFSRVTSGFTMRFHPVLKTWKRHLGVDYAAPTGTPVRSIGDGVVTFAGWQTGYGKVIEIQHDANNSSLFAHLDRIDVHVGQRVLREQDVGAVGQTGWATGPHLHFEIKVKGQQQDPLRFAQRSKALTLDKRELAQFRATARDVLQALAAASATETASAQ